jgi:hypothetical protein
MLASLDQTADVTTVSYGMRLLCVPMSPSASMSISKITRNSIRQSPLDRYFSGNISNAMEPENDASGL